MAENIYAFPHRPSYPEEKGMTLRDYFAAAALTGLFAGRWQSNVHGERHDAYTVDAPRWAENAYIFADAMLKERDK